MIELKKEFTKKGKLFRQVFKDNELVIYSVGGDYEVFRYTTHKPDTFHDDEWEVYPYDEAFGAFAWYCSNPSCVAKVIWNNFPNHQITKQFQKFIKGTYFSGGIEKYIFEVSEKELSNILNCSGARV